MQDIETIMADVATTMRTYLPLKMADLCAEKGDTLFGTSVSDGDYTFNSDAYYVWQMNDLAPYPLAFIQFVDGDPALFSTDNGSDCAKRYTIGIVAIVAENAKGTTAIAQTRIGRAIEEVIRERITGRICPAWVVRLRSTTLRDTNDRYYVTAEVYFTVDII